MKTTTKEIRVPGARAYLVEHDGRPVGTIVQDCPEDVWYSYLGIGDSRAIGTARTAEEAVGLLAK